MTGGCSRGLASTLSRYRRIHVLPVARNIGEAARFLVNSLLVSHGIRRDVLAIVGIGGRWIAAPGDAVRHLRPDADTAEGWVRAVLRGKRLGALVLDGNTIYSLRGNCIVVLEEAGIGGGGCVPTAPPWIALYRPIEGRLDIECATVAPMALLLPAWLAPAVINAELDRVEEGLPPMLCI